MHGQNFWGSFDFTLIGIGEFGNLFTKKEDLGTIRSDDEAIDFYLIEKKEVLHKQRTKHLLI